VGPVVIRTDRLLLREWTAEDAPALALLAKDPRVKRFISAGRPSTDGEIADFIARQMATQAELGWCRWALELREPGTNDPRGVVGFCGPGLSFPPDPELGWWLRPELWDRGLATEAGTAALAYCFETLGMPRVICVVHRDNTASRRVAAKVGFEPEEEFEWEGMPLIRHAAMNPVG